MNKGCIHFISDLLVKGQYVILCRKSCKIYHLDETSLCISYLLHMVGAQLYWLSPVYAHTVAVPSFAFFAVAFCSVHKCELLYRSVSWA